MIRNERAGGKENGHKKICDRKCDECGKIETVRVDAVYTNRRLLNRKIDLCKPCSQTRKYKATILGKKNKNWKHGLNNCGYRLITTESGRKCFEHQTVYEKWLGRQLNKEERIHHIDLNKTNNHLDNLFLCQNMKHHGKIHISLEKLVASFLGKYIWFDRKNKCYSLIQTVNNQSISPLLKNMITKFQQETKSYIVESKGSQQYIRRYWKDKSIGWLTKSEHTVIAEIVLGRKLYHNEVVHHIDHNTFNNCSTNLCVMTRREHSICHRNMQKLGIVLMSQGKIIFDKNSATYRPVC